MMPEDLPHGDVIVFISHSHKDSKWLERLMLYLLPLERDYRVKFWESGAIPLGAFWRKTIENALRRTKVAVLIVSPRFVNSEFICNEELPLILAGGIKVIPVYVEPITPGLKFTYLNSQQRPEQKLLTDIQSPNSPDTPLYSLKVHERDKVLLKVAEEVRKELTLKEPHVVLVRQDELASLRKELLGANSAPELRRVLYKVNDYLMRYPDDPDGRLLRDRVAEAIEWEEGVGTSPRLHRRLQWLGRYPHRVGIIVLSMLVALTAIAYSPLPRRLKALLTGEQTPTPTPVATPALTPTPVSSGPLRIFKPSDGETVGLTYEVSGETPHPAWHHYIVVRPLSYNCRFITSEAVVEGNRWAGRAQFGDRSLGTGGQFEVYVLATTAQLGAGELCALPPDSQLSESVTVTRK